MFPITRSAMRLVAELEGTCTWFKVGLELFIAAGPAVLEPIVARGHNVFLDLKLHDIPNTVAGAVRSAAGLGVRMLTVHAGGGPAMLAAAKAALAGIAHPPELLAVTVLTSMDAGQLQATGVDRPPSRQVEVLAKMGIGAGIRGFVCSPQEVAAVRSLTGPEGVLVIPGIRPAGAAIGDQKRVAGPAEASAAGRQLPGCRTANHAGTKSGRSGDGDSGGDGGGALSASRSRRLTWIGLFATVEQLQVPCHIPLSVGMTEISGATYWSYMITGCK